MTLNVNIMKTKFDKLFVLPILAMLLWAMPARAGGIDFFSGSLAEAQAQASAANKLIFVDAYATWCGPCKWMAANSFSDERVGNFFNRNFINLKIDMERGEGPQLARKYRVGAYPTLFFLDAEGNIVQKETGARDANGLLELAERVLRKQGRLPVEMGAVESSHDLPDAEVVAASQAENELNRIVRDLSQAIENGDSVLFQTALADLAVSGVEEKDYVFIEAQLVWMEEHGNKTGFVTAVQHHLAVIVEPDPELLMMAAAYFYDLDLAADKLYTAQSWAATAVALSPGYYSHDINAVLLHRIGETEAAIEQAEKALVYAKEARMDASQTEAFLAEIKE